MLSYLASLTTPAGKESNEPTQDASTHVNVVNVAVSPEMSDEAIIRQVTVLLHFLFYVT